MKIIIPFSILIFLCSTLNISAQDKEKDTLYFNYSEKYMLIFDVTPNKLYESDSSDDGTFFFEKIGTEHHKDPKKILSLKKYVRTSKYFDKHQKIKLNDYRLLEDLNNYTI